jgi:hypothetical protein
MLNDFTGNLHAKLRSALEAAVEAVLRGGHLSLSQLGRALKSTTAMRYRIKRVDRLLGNRSLYAVRTAIYRKVAGYWLAGIGEILVVIDWSDATADQRWHLLRASVAVEGRSVTLYEEIHPQRKYGNQQVHRLFLARLAMILPVGSSPVIMTDAGFRSTWFDLVNEQHWPWIGRIRGKDMVSIANGPWRRCTEVFLDATSDIQSFAESLYVRSHPTACRLILLKRKAKNRHRHTKRGTLSRAHSSLKASRSAREPWLLACSPALGQRSAADLVAMYAQRMQIEESFRDLKNERLGLGFSAARSRSGRRLEILLLIAHLASWLMRVIGECAQESQMQKFFQSVANPKHKEISVMTLARRVIDAGAYWLRQLHPQNARKILREQATGCSHAAYI